MNKICLIIILMTFYIGDNCIASNSMKSKTTKPSNIQLPLENGKKLIIPMPKMRDDSKQQGEAKTTTHLNREYSEIANWGPAVKLYAKFSDHLDPDTIAHSLSKEFHIEVKPSQLEDRHFDWGQLTSYCVPSTGSTCTYFLKLKGEKLFIVLRSSYYIRIDFSLIKKKQ